MSTEAPSPAFEPTSAIPDFSKDSFSANIDRQFSMRSFEHVNGVAKAPREVHFSPPLSSPIQRAQSLATSVPLLPPVSSASQLPQLSVKTKYSTPQFDVNALFEQTKALREQQAQHFDRERTIFAEERKLWENERAMLFAKIADLESSLNRSGGRRYSSESSTAVHSANTFRADSEYQNLFADFTNSRLRRHASDENHHVWEGPENQVPVTRVFSNEESRKKAEHLPSISENDSSSPKDQTLSPESADGQPVSFSIPIKKVDPRLDGINLKAAVLPPEIKTRVITPTSTSPLRSPPAQSTGLTELANSRDHKKPTLPLMGLLPPDDEKLKLHAGHTPLAPRMSSTGSSSNQSPGALTPRQDKPFAPLPSVRPPTERSDSYFSGILLSDEQQDPELKGPLGLENEKVKDDHFLDELDKKLLDEARKVVSPTPTAMETTEDNRSGLDVEGPRLKMKRSTNFGSAFGSSKCRNL